MAIFHLSVKTVSRSAGRSATAAAAYRAGVEITDHRTGEVHDYTRKGGVESSTLCLPTDAPEWAHDRAALWNAVEQAETRKNSTVAREFEVALPAELSPAERKRLAVDFAHELVERHGVAADVAIHAPGKEGDNRNHHAHILISTRRLGPEGFTEKTRELDDRKSGKELVSSWRERWAELTNERLRENGIDARIDHRTLEAQGIDREPTRHLGPTATAIERRTGEPSEKRISHQEVAQRLQAAREVGQLRKERHDVNESIIDLSMSIAAARTVRDQLKAEKAKQEAEQRRQDDAERRRLAEPIDQVIKRHQQRQATIRQLDLVLDKPAPTPPNQELVELATVQKYVESRRMRDLEQLGPPPEKPGWFRRHEKRYTREREAIEAKAEQLEQEMLGDGKQAKAWRGRVWTQAMAAYEKVYDDWAEKRQAAEQEKARLLKDGQPDQERVKAHRDAELRRELDKLQQVQAEAERRRQRDRDDGPSLSR